MTRFSRPVPRRPFTLLAIGMATAGLMVLGAGCSSGSGAKASDAVTAGRSKLSAQLISDTAPHGYVLDSACIAAEVAKISDAEVAFFADSGIHAIPVNTISPQGEALYATVTTQCIAKNPAPDAALVSSAVNKLIAGAELSQVYTSCVQATFKKMTDDQLNRYLAWVPDTSDPLLDAVFAALVLCPEDAPQSSSG